MINHCLLKMNIKREVLNMKQRILIGLYFGLGAVAFALAIWSLVIA